MLNFIEKWFESCLWNGRFVVVLVVVASMAAAFAIFYMATVDVIYLVNHMLHYADSSLTEGARKLLHDQTISHVVEVVDGYLLATFMLIFSFGMYELFISDIDDAGSVGGGLTMRLPPVIRQLFGFGNLGRCHL